MEWLFPLTFGIILGLAGFTVSNWQFWAVSIPFAVGFSLLKAGLI